MVDLQLDFRELNENDYDDVIQVREADDTFDGMDYLPNYFHMLMKLPGQKCYGAFIQGKLAMMAFLGVIDGGMTAVGRGGRISKKYERTGVYSRFDKFLITTMKSIPGIRYCTATVNNEYYERTMKKFVQNKRFDLIVQKVIHTYSVQIDRMSRKISRYVIPSYVKKLNHKDFAMLFEATDTCRRLFKEERIVVDKVPFRLMKENITHILTEHCTAVGSNITDGLLCDDMLLTCGNYAICAGGLLYNLDIYGENLKDLEYHMVYHLRRIIDLGLSPTLEIHLEVICYEHICKNNVDNILIAFDFKPVQFFRTHMYCLQQLLQSTKQKNSHSKL